MLCARIGRMQLGIFALFSVLSATAVADDPPIQIPAGAMFDVVTGASSTVSDGVYFWVSGQIASANCYYAGYNVSLFYAKPSGAVDPKKALAILMIAKMNNRPVTVQFNSSATQTDLWYYGISSCEITRLSIQ